MTVKLLTEHHLEFVRLKGGCTGSSESTHVKMSNCWKSHALAQMIKNFVKILELVGDRLEVCVSVFGWPIVAQLLHARIQKVTLLTGRVQV